jgi:colanic acid biosynthesis glycosyl transferase WcaI
VKAANQVNILIVSNHFWPENFPINNLAVGLLHRGHQITVLSGIPNYPKGRFFPGYGVFQKRIDYYQGIKVIHVPLIPRGKGNPLRLVLNYASFALCGSLLAPIWCRDQFDAILVYETSPVTVGLPAMALKRLRSTPILFWVQDLWPESLSATGAVHSPLILDLVAILVRRIYQDCDIILSQSRAFSPSIRNLGGDPERIVYFPNSADEFYQPLTLDAAAPERDLIQSGFCLMFAGNIGAAQDFETILAALERLRDYPDIHLVVLGDGRRRPWVETQIAARGLGGQVHLLGRYPPTDMPRFFSLASALLVTLKREPIFALTIPSKVQPYLACGRPIVAALDGEGARIIREAEAGLACPAGDPEALAEAVLTMYRLSETERQAMGRRGRSYFEANFESEMLLDRLESLIAGVRPTAAGGA